MGTTSLALALALTLPQPTINHRRSTGTGLIVMGSLTLLVSTAIGALVLDRQLSCGLDWFSYCGGSNPGIIGASVTAVGGNAMIAAGIALRF